MVNAPDNRVGKKSPDEVIHVILSPYVETPQFFRTTGQFEGAQRWFEKPKVTVVSRNNDSIVLAMPKAYADTRTGISALIVDQMNPSSGGLAEGAVDWDPGLPERLDVQVGPAGRIVIPAVFRDAMKVREGDRLLASVVDGELRLISPPMAIKKAQKMVRDSIPGDDSLADSLIADRRREFEEEFGDGPSGS